MRNDTPGAWHHVMNRGIAHRAAFESRRDIRKFLSLIAREVRKGSLEIHAFCVLGTHYHLLVRSPRGELSAAMQRIQNEYVRWFNRARGRDGPLFRGRFQSRRVTSDFYRRTLVRYIDENPVDAKLVEQSAGYPHGSATCYIHRSGPRWLCRTWVESTVGERTEAPFSAEGYRRVFGARMDDEIRVQLIRSIERGIDPQVDLRSLVEESPARVRDWLYERAKLADGAAMGLPICTPGAVARSIARSVRTAGERTASRGELTCMDTHAALLSELSGLSHVEIAGALNVARSTVAQGCRLHRRRILESPEYAEWTAQIVTGVLSESHSGVATILGIQARVSEMKSDADAR
jgi:REP element-mobilizing transposase RayT